MALQTSMTKAQVCGKICGASTCTTVSPKLRPQNVVQAAF